MKKAIDIYKEELMKTEYEFKKYAPIEAVHKMRPKSAKALGTLLEIVQLYKKMDIISPTETEEDTKQVQKEWLKRVEELYDAVKKTIETSNDLTRYSNSLPTRNKK